MKPSSTQCSKPSTHSLPPGTQRSALIASAAGGSASGGQHFMMNLPAEIKHCTGKGVKVAVIDSGIDLKSPVAKNVKAGIGIGWDGEKAYYHDNLQDENGHGTKICEILLSYAPDVELYVAKIFEKRLLTDMDCLVAGIQWAIEKEVKIINISLGTTNHRNLGDLKECCVDAGRQNIFIISSLSNGNRRSYPGWFSNVLCVFNMAGRKFRMAKNLMIGMSAYKPYLGTNSLLVPIIASAAALLYERQADLDHKNILQRIKNTHMSY